MVLDSVLEVLRELFVTSRRRARFVASGDRLGILMRSERLEGVALAKMMLVVLDERYLYCCSRTSPL